jgi:hypothetical protein
MATRAADGAKDSASACAEKKRGPSKMRRAGGNGCARVREGRVEVGPAPWVAVRVTFEVGCGWVASRAAICSDLQHSAPHLCGP